MEDQIEERLVTRLSQHDYKKLEESIPGNTTLVTSATTDLQAGYQCGVQAVLKVLRDGFVSGR